MEKIPKRKNSNYVPIKLVAGSNETLPFSSALDGENFSPKIDFPVHYVSYFIISSFALSRSRLDIFQWK